jgi:4'-phosphopantetheinyl transferase
LRILLGCYLGVEPERVPISHGENGKPVIAGGTNGEELHFNLSHSGGMAIYAFSGDSEIGVDIEQIRDNVEMTRLVERFFSAREKTEWRDLLESQRTEAFFNGWTRKEAFTKATGEGLSMPLDSFDVSLAPDEPARLLAINGDAGAASGWTMQDLKPASGFAAALTIEGITGAIDIRRWAS